MKCVDNGEDGANGIDPTADYPPEPVEDELIRQLEQWRERLPPLLQFDPKAPLTHAVWKWAYVLSVRDLLSPCILPLTRGSGSNASQRCRHERKELLGHGGMTY